jgi:endonuclease/exonuclease/phosphatase family metal-dependent hydrolase
VTNSPETGRNALLAAAQTALINALVINNFATRGRAAAVAGEINAANPDLVGLQEVTLWRDQTPGDLGTHPAPNARHVVLDQLAVLQRALSARGTPYTAAATSTNADLEGARKSTDGHLVDVRITDRDVLLVRSDLAGRTSHPSSGHYADVRVLPSWPRPIQNVRGWASIDYSPDRRTTVRFLTTHLEVSGPRAGRIQERQAEEALAVIAASPHPVIAMGDFNAQAGDRHTDTYERLTAVLHDVWATAHPGDPGPTCCQVTGLRDPEPQLRGRVDLILTSGDWPVSQVARTGTEPFRRGPAPVWASDHAGVTARIAVTG